MPALLREGNGLATIATVPDEPLFSIIIVAYKSRDEIAACLASLSQTLLGKPVEVVVVDNSRDDGTGLIVRERFPWVKYLTPEMNLGFGRANNLGFATIDPRAEFVLFLNPDTVCNEAALAHCVRRLREDPTIGLISPKLVLADGSMDLACRRAIPTLWDGFCRATGLSAKFPKAAWFSGYNLTHLPQDGTYDVGAINGAFMMGRRDVLAAVALASPRRRVEDESVKFKESAAGEHKADSLKLIASSLPLTPSSARSTRVFDDAFFMYGDDLDLCIRVAKAGYRIVYDGTVSITHLKGVSVAKDFEAMSQAIFDANRDVYLKHFNPRGFRIVRWKYMLAFGAWSWIARLRATLRGHRKVRPL